jgi:Uma2 family endonuclease
MADPVQHFDDPPRFTYGDYIQWSGDERWELIDGIAYAMTAPSIEHQRVHRKVSYQIESFLEDKKCEMFYAPCDVLFPEMKQKYKDVKNMVQPDILVICDKEKIKNKYIMGAPDFIVEILSPSTSLRDRVEKLELYEKHGVREYWIIDPDKRFAEVRLLGENGRWQPASRFDERAKISVTAVPGLEIDLSRVFLAT